MTFIHRIHQALHRHSSRNAFCVNNVFYTYGQLADRIYSIRQLLTPGSGQRVGIVANDDMDTYAAILAVLLSGNTYIPIRPDHPAERIDQILQQAAIEILLSGSGDHVSIGMPVTMTGDLANEPGQSLPTALMPSATSFAYILFTSGSTGVPKGVPVSYNNLDAFVNAFFALGYQLDEHDRFLQMFDLTFDLSVMSYLIPLCLGACVYTVPAGGMKYTQVYDILDRHEITAALMVPSILSFLRPYFSEITLPALRVSLFCGEALPASLVKEWMQCAPAASIANVYGPTEATIFCMAYDVTASQGIAEYNGVVAIGTPMDGMEVIVMGEKMQSEAGEKGELCLCGPQLSPGYLDERKTREAFFELNGKVYYRTGDIVFRDGTGNFMYCGRADQQVKIQGFRVELGEVEFHLARAVGTRNVVALSVCDINGIDRIDAVLEGEAFDTQALMEALKTKLPSYMMPASLHFVASFPLNANGKIDRAALRQLVNGTG